MALALQRYPASDSAAQPQPPMLLIHGLGGDHRMWDHLVPALRKQREVLVCDLPGFGSSAALPSDVEPSPAALAAAVIEMLDQQGLGGVQLVGVSLGSWVSLEIALLGRALSVTALAPAGFWSKPLRPGDARPRQIGRLLEPSFALLMRSPRVRTAVFSGMIGQPECLDPEFATHMIKTYVKSPDFVRVDRAMRARTFGKREELAELATKIPVTVVWGGLDRLVVPPRKLPMPDQVVQHYLDNAGHLPHIDEQEKVVEIINATVAASEQMAQVDAAEQAS